MVLRCHLEAMEGVPALESSDQAAASTTDSSRVSHDPPPSSHDQEGETGPLPVAPIRELSRTHTLVISASSPTSNSHGSYELDDVPLAAFTQVSKVPGV